MATFNITTFSTTAQTLITGETGFIASTGNLVPASGNAVTMTDGILIVAGTILAGPNGAQCVSFTGVPDITVLAGGSLVSARNDAIASSNFLSTNITNDGTIYGRQSAIDLIGASVNINNGGRIESATSTAISMLVTSFVIIQNTGEIVSSQDGITQFGAAAVHIQNSGLILARTEAIETNDGDDTIENSGTLLGNVFMGAGNDRFLGSAGVQNLVIAAAGDDTVIGGAGDERLFGGTENDRLVGHGGDDVIDGDSGDDRLSGGSDNDTLDAGDGNDALVGGEGDDLLASGIGNDTLHGGAGGDFLLGDVGDDRLSGDSDSDTLDAGDGNDALLGGEGDDLMSGGIGLDTMAGGSGDDTLDGGDGVDRMTGGVGDDLLTGGLGQDTLLGEAGADTLTGGGGADTLDGGAGDDELTGGAAADTFLFRPGNGNDLITDFANDVDRLDLRAFDFASLAALTAASSDNALGLVIDLGAGSVVLTGMTLALLTASDVVL